MSSGTTTAKAQVKNVALPHSQPRGLDLQFVQMQLLYPASMQENSTPS